MLTGCSHSSLSVDKMYQDVTIYAVCSQDVSVMGIELEARVEKLIPSSREVSAAACGMGQEGASRVVSPRHRNHNGAEHYHHEEHKLNERVSVFPCLL